MSKLNFKAVESLEPSPPKKKAVFPLTTNGRDLDEKEIESEQKAEKFSLYKYPRIPPVPGTLAFYYRNLEGGNEAVVEHLKNASSTQYVKFAKEFVILWNKMDEFSRRRIDIFDILCEKYNVRRHRFWGLVQEGMFSYQEGITQTALGSYKLELVELLKNMASKDRNQQDRRLLAEATKLITNQPIVKVEDNSDRRSVTINNNSPIPSFAQSISRADRGIKSSQSTIVKQLSEGKQDYIEGELLENEDEATRELQFIESAERVLDEDSRLELAAREL